MTRPGIRLRRLAARWCRARTMERLIDPVLADLQAEYDDAVRHGGKWRSRWILMTGYVAFLKVVVWHGGECAMRFLQTWTLEDQRALIRTLRFCIATIVVVTLLILAPPFLSLGAWNRPNRRGIGHVIMIPQALPISIPVGLTLGIL